MNFTEPIGIIATLFTTSAFLPEVIKAFKKSKSNTSIHTLIIFLVGNTFWLTYGLLTQKKVLIVANIITITLQALLVYNHFQKKLLYNPNYKKQI